MSRKSPRELADDVEELKQNYGATDAPTAVTVEWRVPDDPEPDADGVQYDPETATLTYDVWSAQQDCLDALASGAHDIVAFLGGYGTGKSVLGARWLLAQALAHSDSQFLAVGTSFSEAQHTTFPKLFAQLPGDQTTSDPERSPLVAKYIQSKRLLTLTNGSVIVLGSADSWKRYAGAEFGAIWLDEPSHYECDLHDLLEMLGGRLRGADGPKVQCWTLTGNGYNDAWEILERRQDSTGEPLGHHIEVCQASTLANPYLTPAERDRLDRQYGDTERAKQALHGKFVAAQGRVYSAFTRETHVIPHAAALERVDPDWRAYGYDAGWRNPRVLLELGKTAYDQLVVLDMFYESESHVDDAIDWLDTNEKPDGTIYCEHAPEDIEALNRTRYHAERATKDRDSGIDEVRKRLESDGNRPVQTRSTPKHKLIRRSGNDTDGRRRIEIPANPTPPADTTPEREGRVGLLVSARCDQLVQEFLSYKVDRVGDPDIDDDCLDALRYACLGVARR